MANASPRVIDSLASDRPNLPPTQTGVNMNGSTITSTTPQKLRFLAYGAVTLIGLGFGFDVGQRMSGPIVGSIMAINTAVFGVLCVTSIADWLARARARVGRRV
jgi:hypothetical protein